MTRPYATIRIYLVDQKCIKNVETLKNIAICSDEIFIFTENSEIIKYVYDGESQRFHLLEGNGVFTWSLDDFFETYVHKECEIYIESREKLPFNVVNKRKITKWDKIISDLEKIGYVRTFPTSSFMAVDKRKFYIVAENFGDDVDTAVDVDFLGTAFADEISNKILDIWQRAKGFKVLSKSF